MQKLQFTIVIDAPKEKVWNTMLGSETYKEWTEVFMPGSHFVGDWNKGSKILFVAPDESGKITGMVSRILDNRKYEHVSIEHYGLVQDGGEVTSGESVKPWAGAIESYTFREHNGATEVAVDMDSTEEYVEMFQTTWPKALLKLKELSEK